MFTRTTMMYAVTAASLVAAGSLGLGMSARGSAEDSAVATDWFKPIAASYGNDPRVTPDFDFASLYSAGHPEWFWADGVHLRTTAGKQALANFLAAQVSAATGTS